MQSQSETMKEKDLTHQTRLALDMFHARRELGYPHDTAYSYTVGWMAVGTGLTLAVCRVMLRDLIAARLEKQITGEGV